MTIDSFFNEIKRINSLNSESICPIKNFNISVVGNS